MGLDMYLERMPRYGNTTPSEVSAIESYFSWKAEKENPESKARNYTLKEWCGVDFKTLPPKDVRDFYSSQGKYGYAYWDTEQKYSGRYRIIEEVGYWRKANQIHNWFVENVQDGVDDCGYHNEVTKEDLEELLNICEIVLSSCELIDGKINNGYSYENGVRTPIMEDGKYIKNSSVSEKLLPTTSGFFFGSTSYDEYYVEDIKNTIDIIKKVLETTDFDKQMVYYVSSW